MKYQVTVSCYLDAEDMTEAQKKFKAILATKPEPITHRREPLPVKIRCREDYDRFVAEKMKQNRQENYCIWNIQAIR